MMEGNELVAENELTKEELYDKLLVRGLNDIMILDRHKDVRKEMMLVCPEILQERLAAVRIEIQMKIVEGMLINNPTTLLDGDFWREYVNSALSDFQSCEDSYIYDHGGWFVLLNRIKDMGEPVDWFEVMSKLSMAASDRGLEPQGFSTVLGWLIQADKEHLKKLMYRTETKKYPRELKTQLYKQLIEFGLLDVKVARRIRSDTSGELSASMLACLFENRPAYSDDDFQNLVTQFTDTKHKWVARYIAMNMPMHLVPFLMGIKDQMALDILEKRMEANGN